MTVDFCYQNGQLFSKISHDLEKIKLLKRTQSLDIALIPVIIPTLYLNCSTQSGKCIFFHPLSQAKSFDVHYLELTAILNTKSSLIKKLKIEAKHGYFSTR